MGKDILHNCSKLSEEYLKNKKSINAIAIEYNIGYKATRNALIRSNIKIRSRREERKSRRGLFTYKPLMDRAWLYKQYITDLKSMKEIAEVVGCTSWSINSALNFHNIEKRSISAASLLRYKTSPHSSKYALLNDKDWLFKKFVEEELSYSEIAKEAGVKCIESVRQHLKKFKIFKKRRKFERLVGQSSYSPLNDKKWLKEKYIKERLSTIEIGKLVGCDCATVAQSLRRLNIPVRDKSDGHTFKNSKRTKLILTKDTICLINGGLLGDGSLIKTNGYGFPSYSKSSIHKEYIEYEAKLLFGNNWKKHVFEYKAGESGYKNSKEVIYVLRSLRYKSLHPLFIDWYYKGQDRHIKVIPNNLDMNKQTLLTWFMDDGYSYVVDRKGCRPQIRVYFCTQCFKMEELQKLCEMLRNKFDLTFYVRYHKRKKKCGTGLELELSLKDSIKFFDTIGTCPVNCFSYKWKADILKKWLEDNGKL